MELHFAVWKYADSLAIFFDVTHIHHPAFACTFGTYCFVYADQFRWTGSTDTIVDYESSPVLGRSSCDICGSVVPYSNKEGNHWVTPGGCHGHMRKPDYTIL